MSDFVPTDLTRASGPQTGRSSGTSTGRSSGMSTGLLLFLIVVAFAAGIALTGYAMKRISWFGGTPTTADATAAKPVATTAGGSDYMPANPLNANGEPATVSVDATTLATREAALAGELAALEARTATVTVDAGAAASQATRAEGLLVAFAARRAIDRGLGLGYLDEQLRTRFAGAQPQAVATIVQAAHQPVTLEALRQGLDAVAPNIATVSADGWFRSLQRELGTLVVLRKAGTPSPLPGDRLARAKRLLDGGQVEAARAEVARLPGASDAANWTAAAGRYIAVRSALDLIENAAILGQTTRPAGAQAVAVPATH